MSTVRVELGGGRGYDVHVGAGLLQETGWAAALPAGKVALVADANAYAHHGAALAKNLAQASGHEVAVFEVAAGEKSKSWDELHRLLEFLAHSRIERGDVVVALGGGVATDLAGLAAALWLRGVGYVACPSTLLAMVDASVGGKTGINLAGGKNLVGAFHQPVAVIADVATLATLPERELAAGFAEVVKHGILAPELLELVEANAATLAGEPRAHPELLAELVGLNVGCKAAVVAKDERERGARAQLNLGHTFAHALEAALGYGSLLHGEAVAIGLVAACNLAVRIELASEDLQPRVEALLARFGLPTRFPAYDAAKFAAAMALDKKAASGSLRFVLPVAAGEVKLVPDVPAAAVAETLKELAA